MSSSRDVFGPGRVIDDRYEIVRLVGKGGMGEVYEARESSTGSRVAIKTVLPRLLGNPKIISRFERESALSRRISHPGVLRIHEVLDVPREEDSSETVPCMVMELLEGETLADRLVDGRLLDPDEARPIACQMAAALTAAHRAGVVHRDLKPDNVFLVPGPEGARVVLTDFGVARRSTEVAKDETLTASNVLLGTPDYMAPEQLELQDATPASDIYTLGLVMFEMLTGEPPFLADTALKTVFKRVQEEPPSPREHLPDLDPRWEEVILRCLARDPDARYREAQDLIRVLEGDDSSWLLPSPVGESLRKLLPWLLPLALVAAALVAILLLT